MRYDGVEDTETRTSTTNAKQEFPCFLLLRKANACCGLFSFFHFRYIQVEPVSLLETISKRYRLSRANCDFPDLIESRALNFARLSSLNLQVKHFVI